MGKFTLKEGEEVSSAVDQFLYEYDIPIYLRTSLLSAIENLVEQSFIDYQDNNDIQYLTEQIPMDSSNPDIIDTSYLNKKVESLSNQFTERTSYWNKFLKNEETVEQQHKEERIKTFLYLVSKSTETKEKIINQEELFATEFSILLGKRKDELQYLNDREMEEAFSNQVPPDIIETIVSANMKDVELIESRYQTEITELNIKQRNEFSKFLNDLYWLETTKDDLEILEKEEKQQQQQQQQQPQTPTKPKNNESTAPTTPQLEKSGSSTSVFESIGQNLDKGVQRASSFFSFSFNKKNNPPPSPGPNNPASINQQSSNSPTSTTYQPQQQQQSSTPPPLPQHSSSSNLQQPSPINTDNSVLAPTTKSSSPVSTTANTPNRPSSGSISNVLSSSPPSLSNLLSPIKKQQPPPPQVPQQPPATPQTSYKIYENNQVSVGVQKKKWFEFKLIDASPLHLCKPISSGEYLKLKRVEYIQTLYSDSLSAVVLLSDPSLSFSTNSEKNFIKYCNMSTELHFDPIDKQIEAFKQSLPEGTQLKNGDFFITKHSNLSDVQVVFHLFADSDIRAPLSESTILTTSDLAKGLRNIILTASMYGIGQLTIPIALTDTDTDLNVTNPALINRTVSILSVIRAALTSVHEMTSIKTLQFALPPSLDSGNSTGTGPLSQRWKQSIAPFINDIF
eukprot:gene3315-4154_t